jgi:parallel beta-helix repeat protein
VGLSINGGSRNTIRSVLSTNRRTGIQLNSSDDNLVDNNTLSGPTRWGVVLSHSNDNIVRNKFGNQLVQKPPLRYDATLSI